MTKTHSTNVFCTLGTLLHCVSVTLSFLSLNTLNLFPNEYLQTSKMFILSGILFFQHSHVDSASPAVNIQHHYYFPGRHFLPKSEIICFYLLVPNWSVAIVKADSFSSPFTVVFIVSRVSPDTCKYSRINRHFISV